MDKHDAVNRPAHYTAGKVEVIEYIEDKLTPEQLEGYYVGNVLKYVSRYRHKGGAEDLRKAAWYLDRLINKLVAGEEEKRKAMAKDIDRMITQLIKHEQQEKIKLPPEEYRCHWILNRECYNEKCRTDHTFRFTCKNEYFLHHQERPTK